MRFEFGLEIHVSILGGEKFFSSGRYMEVIDEAQPGTMPSINYRVLPKCMRMLDLLNYKNREKRLYFDRKIYYYHDIPNNYQITQKYRPIGTNGFLAGVLLDSVHLESDTGSTTYGVTTETDLTRLNNLLAEITTKVHEYDEKLIVKFLKTLRMICISNHISDCVLERGNMRFDLNLSCNRKYRAEFKNLNLISAVSECFDWYKENYTKLPEDGPGNTVNYSGGKFLISRKKTEYPFVRETNLPNYALGKKHLRQIGILHDSKYYEYYIPKFSDLNYTICNKKGLKCKDYLIGYKFVKEDIRFVEIMGVRDDFSAEDIIKTISLLDEGYVLKKHIKTVPISYIQNIDKSLDETDQWMKKDIKEVYSVKVENQVINYKKLMENKKNG